VGVNGRQVDELADRVGHRRPPEQGSEEFENPDDHDRLGRRHCPRSDDGRHDVRGIVKAVGVIEEQHDHNGRYGKPK
jgi:hypothetical protein